MTEKIQKYSIGDWIVHLHFGVGQIKKTEVKTLQGESIECFKVQTKAGTYWLPCDQEDNPRVRPITSREGLKRGLEILNKQPRHIDADYKQVKKQIDKVRSDGSFVSIARLVRDLSARSMVKPQNTLEEQTLKSFKERFLKEWSLCMEISVAAVQSQFHNIIPQNPNSE
jgi:RNA polymerase-interacting CarD/CdnL/TRCF family regulator